MQKVTDAAADATTNYSLYNDIRQGQLDNNYQYDATGNLTGDASEGISNIGWTVYGKISSITKGGSTINYSYDASGNRLIKSTAIDTTVYVRDGSGNVMSVYVKKAGGSLVQAEMPIYGSSRLGMATQHLAPDTSLLLAGGFGTAIKSTFTRGEKFFELSNHLGNVLATLTDRRMQNSTAGVNVDYYTADILAANDYYPFGMQMPGRTYQASTTSKYRYSINGQEKESELNENITTAKYWEYDSRIGRRWNVEPEIANFPNLSSYVTFSNNPVNAVDPDGKRFYFVGGAGNDSKGWNYINRFKNIFTPKGIQNFVRVNASGGTASDIAFTFAFRNYGGFTGEKITVGKDGKTEIQLTRREHKQIQKAVNDIVADLTNHPLKDGEQLNLAGYSYGSVLQAQVALRLADKGIKVDNLVLIGSPISDQSPLYKELTDNPNIKKVIRHDIPGDKFSNPKSEGEFLKGAQQNKDPHDKGEGPHFDLARPGAEADKKIGELGDKLKKEGVK